MSHYYQYVFSINRLHLAAHLGCYAKERSRAQQVEASVRFYFPKVPDCAVNDNGSFIDYDTVSNDLHRIVAKEEFRLIEYMAMQLYRHVRKVVNKQAGKDVKIWIKLTKLAPPVPHLQGGASFVYSDLPADARVIDND